MSNLLQILEEESFGLQYEKDTGIKKFKQTIIDTGNKLICSVCMELYEEENEEKLCPSCLKK